MTTLSPAFVRSILTAKPSALLITVILYGRMIEIYLYCSVSPIPFATMTNREWGQIGNNYLKSLFAIGFQGFLIMICVGIYAVLVNNMIIADNLHSAIFSLALPVDIAQAGQGIIPIFLLSPISIILIQQQNGSKSPVFITFMAQKIPRTAGPQGPAAGGFHLTESVSYFS